MSDELKPALTPEQWRALAISGEWRLDGENLLSMRPPAIVACVAMANGALPADSPYKITRADVDALRSISDQAASEFHVYGLDDLAAKLSALLPP